MSKVERFEDLIAWQKARGLAREIYLVTKSGEFVRDFRLSGQMRSAAVSIMSNVAERYERSSSAEFHQFLVTAKASCAELRSQLFVAFDIGYLDQSKFDSLLARAEEVARILGGLRASIERRRNAKAPTHRSSLITHR
jgi:four helix bundle protein